MRMTCILYGIKFLKLLHALYIVLSLSPALKAGGISLGMRLTSCIEFVVNKSHVEGK